MRRREAFKPRCLLVPVPEGWTLVEAFHTIIDQNALIVPMDTTPQVPVIQLPDGNWTQVLW